MAIDHTPVGEERPPVAPAEPPGASVVPPAYYRDDEPPGATIVPPAFYRDDEPPEPPDDDPHWREFPAFDAIKGSRLLIIGIVVCVLFATVVHLLVLLAVTPGGY